MKFKELPLKESFLVELEKNTDNRGFFSRLFCDNEFKTICDFQISQVNNAFSYDKAILRGIHLQKEPFLSRN